MTLRYKTTSAALSRIRQLPFLSLSSITRLQTPQPVIVSQRPFTTTPATPSKMKESDIKRNPHPDFKKVEASRPPFDASASFTYTQTPAPDWAFGSGANGTLPAAEAAQKQHISIDPFAEGRPSVHNYKLLISGIVPRPIALVSTVDAATGASTNLAPFSYFQMINHDPPLFVVGFVGGLEQAVSAKHTLHNLHATGECTINLISEHYVEAANATSVNAPAGVSEWAVSGLTPAHDCETVKAPRVKEAVFSIEGRLESVREFGSKSRPETTSGTMAVIEGTRFWVREDAINEERTLIDPAVSFPFSHFPFPCLQIQKSRIFLEQSADVRASFLVQVLRPISRIGGITYGRSIEGLELLRPDFDKDFGGMEAYQKLEAERGGKDDKNV